MPNRKVHNFIGRALGLDPKLVDAVNRDMDAASKWLGPSHRKVGHSDLDAMGYVIKYRTPQAALAAKVHQITDQLASSNPELRRFLLAMEPFL